MKIVCTIDAIDAKKMTTTCSHPVSVIYVPAAFGCATEDFQPPNPETTLDLSATNFGYSDNQYQGLLVCDTGYLMPDLADAKATYCRSSPIERTTRRRWQWDLPTEQTTCNSK